MFYTEISLNELADMLRRAAPHGNAQISESSLPAAAILRVQGWVPIIANKQLRAVYSEPQKDLRRAIATLLSRSFPTLSRLKRARSLIILR